MSANPLLPLYIRFYVDALNFYYGVARKYGIKWIDMEKLLISLVREKFPNAEVEKILIFTAIVKDNPPGTEQRQLTYLSALKEHSPSIEIILGRFNFKWEEKQTDVNLACRMVEDAHLEADSFDACCLVSKDGDFLYPLKAKRRLKQRMLLIAPRTTDPKDRAAPQDIVEQVERKDRISQISRKLVRSCQLPDEVGEFTKPPEWEAPEPDTPHVK